MLVDTVTPLLKLVRDVVVIFSILLSASMDLTVKFLVLTLAQAEFAQQALRVLLLSFSVLMAPLAVLALLQPVLSFLATPLDVMVRVRTPPNYVVLLVNTTDMSSLTANDSCNLSLIQFAIKVARQILVVRVYVAILSVSSTVSSSLNVSLREF
jgi:hypothetical protein